MGWKPEDHVPEDEQTDYDDRPVPIGIYLAGLTWFAERGRSGSILRLRAEVIGQIDDRGQFRQAMVGRSFFFPMYTDLQKKWNAHRWYWWAKASGVLDLDLDFSHEQIWRDIIGTGCVIRLTYETRNYTDRDGSPRTVKDGKAMNFKAPSTPEAIRALAEWRDKFAEVKAERAEKAAQKGHTPSDASGFGDDPGPLDEGGVEF